MNATTIEISRDQWKSFFNDLNKVYPGWSATIEELAGELGDQPLANGLPLQGVSFDPIGSQAGDILVEVGDTGQAFQTHLVHKPRAVRTTATELGGELDIEIESEEGDTTLLRLRPRPALPPAETKKSGL